MADTVFYLFSSKLEKSWECSLIIFTFYSWYFIQVLITLQAIKKIKSCDFYAFDLVDLFRNRQIPKYV